ncbi:sacsin N-terminal ATP-binding-like domain-containing protein [Chryseobacterium sp. JUb7]|uniref:sacsin N-terminal ATP-binding-like domain-containing protein n=1 Tax=Chryseobacterium sp. JUb7 TaxID=2940599 RepID=UPI0021685EB2|nr:DUF3883 domain-containing protein [Chryseobacterium sp. JUb7]MCS3532848.1 hypothetical protein [Chryseobacterium sp. JUb7]
MLNTETTNREEIIQQTRRDDERSDLKQHADKMLRDFEKFNDFSSNRAIWELVQNACDLSSKCEITIDYRNERISFSHNGKPFNTKSLISLIKQVSGKYGEQQDIKEVGKYGTGFLTTHTFGRKFSINSVLDTGEFYLPINDFEIDRTPKTWELLSDNISDQKKRVYEILKNETAISIDKFLTTFTYQPETVKEVDYIKKSLTDLDEYIPYVFTINDRLNKIILIDENQNVCTYTFDKKSKVETTEDINLFKTVILKDNEEIFIYSIIDEEEEIEIILPINKDQEVFEFNERLARLFLYYPLIGSEDFGINFIINCKNFLPTEPRDGIHLNSDKYQVKDQEEKNRHIIEKCTNLIFDFLNSNAIEVSNPLLYSTINFKTNSDDLLLNEYFQKLQISWNSKFKSLPFVNTLSGYRTVQEAEFLSPDFLDTSPEIFDCCFELLSKFYNLIPQKENIIKWSKNVIDWNDDEITLITHQDLLEKIRGCTLEDFNAKTLNQYYSFLIDRGFSTYFSSLELIPNIDGKFHKTGILLLAKDLDNNLITLGKTLIPDSIDKLIHKEFLFNFNLEEFNRRDFSNDIKISLDQKDLSNYIYFPKNLSLEDYHSDLVDSTNKIDNDYFISLLRYCMIVNNKESLSKPNQLIKKICQYYGLEDELFELKLLSEESENIEYRSTRKNLIKVFFNLVALHNNEWVQKNQKLLFDLCSLNDDSYKDIYKESKIYPNQLFELHLLEVLKRDLGVKESIKKIYLDTTRKDINEVLVISEFNDFLPEANYIDNRHLTTIIENIIFQENVINIDSHTHKDIILKIIPKLTDKEYQNLFPQLDDKKANIMISVVTQEETKDDIFAIVTLDSEKLKKIGKLIQQENFEELINKAENIIIDEQQSKSNFEHKYKIGTFIENQIRAKLDQQLNDKILIDNLESRNEQGGQDIVIRLDDEPIYYIEVKSRWDKRNSVTMSKLQLERAALNWEKYCLCSVDITHYEGDNNKYNLPIEDILPLVKIIDNIGNNVKPLVENNIKAEERIEDQVHLTDYRGVIPQNIIETGSNFETFVSTLVTHIKTAELNVDRI